VAHDKQHWLNLFLQHLQTERRLSINTRIHYRRDLDELLGWCEQAGIG
jgi:site-specific recombinase XerD